MLQGHKDRDGTKNDMCAIPLLVALFIWKRATRGAPSVMWPIYQFDHSIFVSNVTFQMGINTGEVEIAGLSETEQVFKVYTKNDTILCEMLFLDEN